MRELWEHVFGDQRGILALFSGLRAKPGSKRLDQVRSAYFSYPHHAEEAGRWCSERSEEGREVYFCAHLLTAQRRIKANAAPLLSLYVDGDGAKVAAGLPDPTAVIESSPGREQFYFRLSQPVAPEIGERLNRRLALAMGADDSGWDLTQLLRPPGTRNHKYPEAPAVKLMDLAEHRHDPDELELVLPPASEDPPRVTRRVSRPSEASPASDLARLSPRM